MRIVSVEVKGLFKQNFDGYPGTNMVFEFTDQVGVIIGPNGAGKTTVQRLIHEFFRVPEWNDEIEVQTKGTELSPLAAMHFESISNSEVIWNTPFTSIRFDFDDDKTLHVAKQMAGSKPSRSDFLTLSIDEKHPSATTPDTGSPSAQPSIRIFSPAHQVSMNDTDFHRASSIYNDVFMHVSVYFVPVNRLLRIEESAFDDDRLLSTIDSDYIQMAFLDGDGVTLDVIPEVYRKWVSEANEFWRSELVGLSSSLLSSLTTNSGLLVNTRSNYGIGIDDMPTPVDIVGLRESAERLHRVGVNLFGIPTHHAQPTMIAPPGTDAAQDNDLRRPKSAVDWLFHSNPSITGSVGDNMHSIVYHHLKNSIQGMENMVVKMELISEFPDEFFTGKYCDYNDEDGFNIRLNKYTDSYAKSADTTDILPLSSLSSGEQHAIIMLMSILQGEKDSLILIDEPETSLHIEWQEELLPWLVRAADCVGADLLITTHSPHILSDHRCNVIKIPFRSQEE